MSVEIEVKQVNLRQVAGNDKDADLLLKPGDRLSIRQIAGWKDIGGLHRYILQDRLSFVGSCRIDPEGAWLRCLQSRRLLPKNYERADRVLDKKEIKKTERQQLAASESLKTMTNTTIADNNGHWMSTTSEYSGKECLVPSLFLTTMRPTRSQGIGEYVK